MINEKLKEIPPIRYINLDHRTERKEYLESEFEKWGIENYTRLSASKYSSEVLRLKWNDLVDSPPTHDLKYTSILINQLHNIFDWYESNTSETCLILEDDLSFDLVEYWNFDWKYLMSKIPCNWDCVQFHILGLKYIQMNLHKRTHNNQGATCYMINRHYAKKLLNNHFKNGKFKFHTNYGRYTSFPKFQYQSPDFVPYEMGLVYSMPIFTTNESLKWSSDAHHRKFNLHAKVSDTHVRNWWKNESKKYNLEELFYIDTPKTKDFIFKIDNGQEW